MYDSAATDLDNAAERIEQYRVDLRAMADGLDGKKWGVEVHGPLREMDGDLFTAASKYRELAAQMKHQGDNVADAHDANPWVPPDGLGDEYPTFDNAGSPAMADAAEPTSADQAQPDFAAIAAQLREIETEDEGRAYLDAQRLDKDGLLAVATALQLTRLERKSMAEIKRRIIQQAIGGRRKFRVLREGWQKPRTPLEPESEKAGEFTPVPFEAPPPEALESGPFAQHKLPDAAEDQEFRDMIAEYFDPMQDKDPRSLKATLDDAPDDQRDAWNRRADEIAHAWGSSLHGPGSLFEYIEPEANVAARGQQPDAGNPTPSAAPAANDVQEPVSAPAPAPTPAPAPAPASAPVAKPVSGWPSDKRIAENTWGDLPTKDSVHYHDDGPIGTAVRYMGSRDAQMDVDGEPLANVLGQVATDVVRGRRTAQQAVEDLKVLRDRLPEVSHARACLGRAIEQMDGPDLPAPAIPDGTPQPLRDLVETLRAVPIVRSQPEKEFTPLLGLIEDVASGETSMRMAASLLRDLRNKRHESFGDAGKFEIDRAIDAAIEQMRALKR